MVRKIVGIRCHCRVELGLKKLFLAQRGLVFPSIGRDTGRKDTRTPDGVGYRLMRDLVARGSKVRFDRGDFREIAT